MSIMDEAKCLIFYVNGRKIVEKRPDPDVNLLSYLRYKLRLTGCKVGCEEGGCGACTVMVSEYDRQANIIRHYSANACLLPLCFLHGLAITTVEGIGSTKTRLHPVQERLAESYGSQCGFCTPGMVMSMYALLRNYPKPTEQQLRNYLDGNLCRCTGYRPILQGFRTFTQDECGMGKDCCRNKANANEDGEVKGIDAHHYSRYESTQEPIFPPELKNNWAFYHEKPLVFKNDHVIWHRPGSLSEILELKASHPDARIVIGNTEIAIDTRFKGHQYPVRIQATHVPELKAVSWSKTAVTFGSAVTVAVVIDTLRTAVKDLPEEETRIYRGMLDVLQWFGGTQVKNVSSIGGNILTASPLSDLNPLLMAAGATLQVVKKGSSVRQVKMDASFLPSYRTTSLAPEDVLLSVTISKTDKHEFYHGYKQSSRKEEDMAIVNAGMRVEFEENSDVVKDLYLAFGGMGSTTVMAANTMKSLVGSHWNNDMLTKATTLLAEELPLEPGCPGGMCEYRQTLTASLFFKFYLAVQLALAKQKGTVKPNVPMSYQSAVSDIDYPLPTTSHVYDDVSSEQTTDDTVGRPVVHESGIQHTTGEAKFLDDVVPRSDELFMSLVLSERAHAMLVSVDPTDALAIEGVNMWGRATPDEEVFATKKVLCKGQTIGAIVAETRETARRAALKVKIIYEDLEPVLTIKEAIAQKSFYGGPVVLTSGDPEPQFESCDQVIEAEARTGAQEHFYMETMGSLVIPGMENGRIEVHVGTQMATLTQKIVGNVLGLSSNRIVVRVKRIGGAFGGKQSRVLLTTLPAAVAAHKLGRPVRCILDRDVDMMITGTRHPVWAKYKVGFNNDGRILAYCPEVYLNAGMSEDCSKGVLQKMKVHMDNSYNIPNLKFTGNACRTNIPSNTALRGFGVPQIALVTEQMIQLVADTLDKSPEQIRRVNMYHNGDFTHFNQKLSDCNIRRCWDECMVNSLYEKRRREVDAFNSENRWKKRGLSMVPVKYGLSFTASVKFVSQASALVHIYLDGSVLITHGGVEFGQGLNTKMIQVASRVLHIPMSFIHCDECSTDKINNASPTGASATADLQGMAVKDACHTLYDRILPYKQNNSNGTWKDWVNAAYIDRVQLMATGFYNGFSALLYHATMKGHAKEQHGADALSFEYLKPSDGVPGLHYDPAGDNNTYYSYYVYGAGCSEVEVDCLTGEHHVLRTDLVIDAGRSLNPAVDIGQIEGAFTHGYGLYILEEYKVSPDGTLLSQGPGNYKIPTVGNIPWRFNVHLLKESDNNQGIYESKGQGEPPMILSLSAFFAISDAIKSARADAGITDRFQLDCPATPETVRLACRDQFTQKFPIALEGSYKPWTVDLS